MAKISDDKWNTSPPLELYTDAAVLKGYGAIFGLHWFFCSFMDQWQSLNFTYLCGRIKGLWRYIGLH